MNKTLAVFGGGLVLIIMLGVMLGAGNGIWNRFTGKNLSNVINDMSANGKGSSEVFA